MLSLNLSAPFLPSALLYWPWRTCDSARKVNPFHFLEFTSVSPALRFCLDAICIRFSRRDLSGGSLLHKLHIGFTLERMLGLFAVKRSCLLLGRTVPTSVKRAAVRPWPGQCWLHTGNFTNYHYATDLPISEGWPERLWCESRRLLLDLASSDFLELCLPF